MIALYCDTRGLRNTIEGLLADVELKSTDSRDEFRALVADAAVTIAGLRRCSEADAEWLGAMFRPGVLGPAYIVVTPLSLAHVRRLRRIRSSRFHTVWVEEVGSRLPEVLAEVDPWQGDPIRHLGRRMLRDYPLHGFVVEAIRHICLLSDLPSADPPESSVTNLARLIGIAPDTLRRHWRSDVPLRCGPKRLLSWSLLLWAVRDRPRATWDDIAMRAGLGRRTLERYSARLAGCSLASLGGDPTLARRRFLAWLAEVAETESLVTSTSLPPGYQRSPRSV